MPERTGYLMRLGDKIGSLLLYRHLKPAEALDFSNGLQRTEGDGPYPMGKVFGSVSAAREYLTTAFSRMFPEHTCESRCSQPQPRARTVGPVAI
jgi:hypothetical protein